MKKKIQTSVAELMEYAAAEDDEEKPSVDGDDDGVGDVDQQVGSLDMSDGAVSGQDAQEIVRRVESEILTLGKHKMNARDVKAEPEAG